MDPPDSRAPIADWQGWLGWAVVLALWPGCMWLVAALDVSRAAIAIDVCYFGNLIYMPFFLVRSARDSSKWQFRLALLMVAVDLLLATWIWIFGSALVSSYPDPIEYNRNL